MFGCGGETELTILLIAKFGDLVSPMNLDNTLADTG